MNPDTDIPLLIEHAHPRLQLDEETLRRLVRCVLAAEYLTDVLSFPLADADDETVDGEIYVDLDTAAEQHKAYAVSFEEEARRYVVHGLLHLLGYDDTTDAERAAMRRLEDRYLAECT